jgi:hypothetical protein
MKFHYKVFTNPPLPLQKNCRSQMDAILSTHNFGVTCDPHCYLTPYARCMCSDSIFVGMEKQKLQGFC